MSSLGYDEALLKKFQSWIADNTLQIIGPADVKQMFQYNLDTKNDKPIELPMIVLRRLSPMTIENTTKRPLTHDAATMYNDGNKGAQLNSIPIILKYQLDIYTRYFNDSDEYVRDFIFKIINNPRVTIEIPYNNSNVSQNAYIRLDQDIEDNSDIPERLIPGQFTRRTISFSLDNAWLYNYKIKDTVKISDFNVEVDIKPKDKIQDD